MADLDRRPVALLTLFGSLAAGEVAAGPPPARGSRIEIELEEARIRLDGDVAAAAPLSAARMALLVEGLYWTGVTPKGVKGSKVGCRSRFFMNGRPLHSSFIDLLRPRFRQSLRVVSNINRALTILA